MKLPGYLGLGLFLLLGGAYTGYWFLVAAKLQAGIESWTAEQRAMGSELEIAEGTIGGFPFAFRRDFGAAWLATPASQRPVTLSTRSLVAEVRPWSVNVVTFTAQDAVFSSDGQSYSSTELHGTVDISTEPPADYHRPFLGFDLTASDVHLPPGTRAVTTGPIKQLSARGAVMGPVPTASDLATALRGWAQAGGVLELKSFTFVQAPLEATGEGTLALDEMLQPLGAVTVRAHGVAETVALLEQDSLIDERTAKTANLMVQGLGKADETGRKRVDVSLSLQQGYLWLGPVKLARLPSFDW